MEINQLFGLPAHPILVHAAVVLVPLAVIGLFLIALLPSLRPKYSILVAVVAFVATGSVGLAQGSGEALLESVKRTQLVVDHAQMGEDLLPWAFGVLLAAAFLALVEVMRRRDKPLNLPAKATSIVVVVFSLLVSAGAIYTVIKIGHSGAKATWNSVKP